MATLISIQHTNRFDGSYTIFELCDGRNQAYMTGDYKKESTAKAQVTRRFNTNMYEDGSKVVTTEDMQAEIDRRNQPSQDTVVEQVEASQEAQPTPEQFQFNIGSFFQAVYDYCYSQVSDYLPQPHDYIYGSPNRPMSPTWARIEEAHYVQVDRRTEGVYTWVAVPYQLSLNVMENYELTFIKAPEALQVAWNDLRSAPPYTERPLEHKDGICDQCGHPDKFFYPLRLDGCTEWYCGACFELHVIFHTQRAIDRYEGEHYQDGQLQPVKL